MYMIYLEIKSLRRLFFTKSLDKEKHTYNCKNINNLVISIAFILE